MIRIPRERASSSTQSPKLVLRNTQFQARTFNRNLPHENLTSAYYTNGTQTASTKPSAAIRSNMTTCLPSLTKTHTPTYEILPHASQLPGCARDLILGPRPSSPLTASLRSYIRRPKPNNSALHSTSQPSIYAWKKGVAINVSSLKLVELHRELQRRVKEGGWSGID